MRKTFYSLLAAFSLVACSENPLEQQNQLYCAAIEKADTISSLSAVVDHCLSTRTDDIRILEQYKSGGGEELQERFGDEYASLLSGVECLRDSFCAIMDSKFVACKKQEGVSGTNEPYSVLNLKGNTTAQIKVSGGQFYKFNPSDNLSENPKVDFVIEGYKSVQQGDWFVVVKK